MRPTLLLLLLSAVMQKTSAQKRLVIDDRNYAWKSYDALNFQQVDLSEYKSPNLRPGQDPDRIVVLCASGGGLRAAAFTMGVLLELERIGAQQAEPKAADPANVANEIDFFSTTSGGGWGVTTFLAHRYTRVHALQDAYPTYNSFETYLANWVDRPYFKHQIKYLLRSLLPGHRTMNRRSSITMTNRLNMGYVGYGYLRRLSEDAYKKKHGNLNGYRKDDTEFLTLGDVFTLRDEKRAPQLPMMIANTTNVATFSLVPFTPDRLHFWGVREFSSTAYYVPPVRAPRGQVLSQRELLDVPLAAAIKASSSVPGAIGASSFPAIRTDNSYYLHLEDGGIVDNIGLHTARSILRQTRATISDPKKRVVFIVDAARSGIDVVLPQQEAPKRSKTLLTIAKGAAPDAQYNLMREAAQALANEADCTVIYLGTENLLNPGLGVPRPLTLGAKDHIRNTDAARRLYQIDVLARKDPNFFAKTCAFADRRLLYEYIRTNINTWFSAKETVNKGEYLVDPDKTTGYGKIMMLAGRASVQLKADEIRRAMGYRSNG